MTQLDKLNREEQGGSMNSIIAWIGGKRLMRKEIIKMLPSHQRYVEVFGGAGWVLFGKSNEKTQWTDSNEYQEVYNDLNADLVSFWKYVRQHPEALSAELDCQLASRQLFDERKQYVFRTELERVTAFYLQLSCSFGSKSEHFNIRLGNKVFPLRNSETVIKASERLKNVIIENLDFETLIRKYDKNNSFFFCDPPYYTQEDFYSKNGLDSFNKHNELKQLLSGIEGKFLLTYNDHEFIRDLYKDFNIHTTKTRYTLSGKFTDTTNLIITNY